MILRINKILKFKKKGALTEMRNLYLTVFCLTKNIKLFQDCVSYVMPKIIWVLVYTVPPGTTNIHLVALGFHSRISSCTFRC